MMMTTRNAKGPASLAGDPDHGPNPNPLQGIQNMNKDKLITEPAFTARDFPIEGPGHEPEDDMFEARAYLRILAEELERSSGREIGMPKRNAQDMMYIIGQATVLLDRLQRVLDHDDFPRMRPLYEEVRRAELLEVWEAGR